MALGGGLCRVQGRMQQWAAAAHVAGRVRASATNGGAELGAVRTSLVG
jgi:hypothetical protein